MSEVFYYLPDPAGRHYCDDIPSLNDLDYTMAGATWTCPVCHALWVIEENYPDDNTDSNLIWVCDPQSCGKLRPV